MFMCLIYLAGKFMLIVFTIRASRHCCLVTVLCNTLWVQQGFPGWAHKAYFTPILTSSPELRCLLLMFHWVNISGKCKSKCSLTDGFECCAWEQMVIGLKTFTSLQKSTVKLLCLSVSMYAHPSPSACNLNIKIFHSIKISTINSTHVYNWWYLFSVFWIMQ
jgi:hypothetical protein